MDRVEAIVVGAGVVGLAIARRLAQSGHEVLILETENAIGTVTSSRNSGVIHAGIYYRPGSLKAELCVKGRKQIYDYARDRHIPHRQCGKLIVATDAEQVSILDEFQRIGLENGAGALQKISRFEAQAMEPEVYCVAAVVSPETGIIDQHAYMLALQADAEAAGATLVLMTPVNSGQVCDGGFILNVGGAVTGQIKCRMLINAAGLGAQRLAAALVGLDETKVPPQVLAKGNYFKCTGKPPFKMLIYPLPVYGSSGLHATCDLDGNIRFGPDVEWVDHIDYRVDPARSVMFEEAVQRYWPNLRDRALTPDYCGIRPKIARASPDDTDFIIQSRSDHGVDGLINLFGIESPGLTASLAVADEVVARVQADR